MNTPTNRLSRILALIGGVLLILMGIAHGMGHVQPEPPPANETEAQLRTLMKTYEFDAFGSTLSYYGILDGFSWFFTIGCLGIGLAIVVVLFPRAVPPWVLRRGAAIGALVCIATAGVGYGRWPTIPPVVGIGAAGLCLVLSALTVRSNAKAP